MSGGGVRKNCLRNVPLILGFDKIMLRIFGRIVKLNDFDDDNNAKNKTKINKGNVLNSLLSH